MVLGQDGAGLFWRGRQLFSNAPRPRKASPVVFQSQGLGLRSWAACYRSHSVPAHLREDELARVGLALQGRTCYWVELAAFPLVASLFVQSVGMEQ
mgnify:CR=1 FL=1